MHVFPTGKSPHGERNPRWGDVHDSLANLEALCRLGERDIVTLLKVSTIPLVKIELSRLLSASSQD